MIAMILACTMLVSISPAVAAEDASARPTVEEILSEYHKAAFEEKRADETGEATTYSLHPASDAKTLEQATVDTLNSAGYEAYHITSANYDTLENHLQTDFSDIGLDPNGSYIIVVSGDDSEVNSSTGTTSRAVVPAPDPGGSSFNYTYNGQTYSMRYVTVTPTEISQLKQVSPEVELLDENSDNLSLSDLNLYLSVLSFVPAFSTSATVLSLLISSIPDEEVTLPASLSYKATSIWNITYTQVYHSQNQIWKSCSRVEYVIPQYFLNYYYYNPYTNLFHQTSANGQLQAIYSEHYNDTEYIKQQAVLAYAYNTRSMDIVEEVIYECNGDVIDTHYRRWESIDFNPPT